MQSSSSPKERMYLDWHDVELCVLDIVDHMVISHAKPEAILAIGKGGFIPAAMISYHFGSRTGRIPRMDALYARSYHGELREQVVTSGLFEAAERLKKWRHAGQLLIVDDIADSGSTLKHLLQWFPKARTAVLIHKEVSVVKPDFSGRVDKDGDKRWYVFPWEHE